MPHYFLDTSALAKHYHHEVGSDVVAALLADTGSSFSISRLALTETVSLFPKKIRTGLISDIEFDDLKLRFLSDINSGLATPARILNGHFDAASALLSKYGKSRHLYALDALQLAVAQSIRQPVPIDHFVCSDQRLIQIARLEGLKVLDPEHP